MFTKYFYNYNNIYIYIYIISLIFNINYIKSYVFISHGRYLFKL